jgi:hypothetical protein
VRPAPLLALLSLSTACSYDLEVLKGRRTDAGLDASVDMPVADVMVDRAQPDVAADVPRDMTAIDTGPARPPSMGTCVLPGLTVEPAPAATNGVTVINGNTMGGAANPLVPSCQPDVSMSSTRVYRYEVQNGPRVVATANTGLCGAHDTVLAAYFSCEGGGRLVSTSACNDDDMVNLCGTCGDAGVSGGCGTVHPTLDLSSLVPRDVIYFVVTSYSDGRNNRGPFRLSIAENGLTPQPAPTGLMSESPANRCACPPTTMPMTGDVAFPRMGDTNQLATPSRLVLGGRDLPFSRVTGVSAKLNLTRYNVDTGGPCGVSGGARAALDLLINTTVVATGSLGIGSGSGGFVTIPFNTFAPITFTPPTGIPLTYRVRNVEPPGVPCITLDVDLTAPNTVTLYSTN